MMIANSKRQRGLGRHQSDIADTARPLAFPPDQYERRRKSRRPSRDIESQNGQNELAITVVLVTQRTQNGQNELAITVVLVTQRQPKSRLSGNGSSLLNCVRSSSGIFESTVERAVSRLKMTMAIFVSRHDA